MGRSGIFARPGRSDRRPRSIKKDMREKAINEIKRQLWNWRFKVRDTRGIAPFDLLANAAIRIKVVTAETVEGMKISLKDCDVLAVYVPKTGKKFYSAGSGRSVVPIDKERGYKIFQTFRNSPKFLIGGDENKGRESGTESAKKEHEKNKERRTRNR